MGYTVLYIVAAAVSLWMIGWMSFILIVPIALLLMFVDGIKKGAGSQSESDLDWYDFKRLGNQDDLLRKHNEKNKD